MDWALKRQGGGVEESNGDNVVRLRGLPYQATKQDVVAFFEGEIRIRRILYSERPNTGCRKTIIFEKMNSIFWSEFE